MPTALARSRERKPKLSWVLVSAVPALAGRRCWPSFLEEQDMHGVPMMRFARFLAAGALAFAFLPSACAQAGAGSAGGSPRARSTGTPIQDAHATLVPGRAPVLAGLPSEKQQIKVLAAVLRKMRRHYPRYAHMTPGPQDIFDYGIGRLWMKGIDGAGTTIAVMEGWKNPEIARVVDRYDKMFGLPKPQISTIF